MKNFILGLLVAHWLYRFDVNQFVKSVKYTLDKAEELNNYEPKHGTKNETISYRKIGFN